VQCLRREKVVRVFKLNTGQDDHAIIFLDDYLNQVDRIVKRMEEKKQSDLEIFKLFKMHVLDSKLEPSIGHHELLSLLSLGGKVKDAHITLLINAGLLVSKELYFYLSVTPCKSFPLITRNSFISDTPTYRSRHVLVCNSEYR